METTDIKTNSSLSKKTKAELVDIILRKDNVHKELNEKINTLTKECDEIFIQNKKLNSTLVDVNLENEKLNCTLSEYQDTIDEYTSVIKEKQNSIKCRSIIAIIEFIMLIIIATIVLF